MESVCRDARDFGALSDIAGKHIALDGPTDLQCNLMRTGSAGDSARGLEPGPIRNFDDVRTLLLL